MIFRRFDRVSNNSAAGGIKVRPLLFYFFNVPSFYTERRYASAVYSVVLYPSVCLPVCHKPSHGLSATANLLIDASVAVCRSGASSSVRPVERRLPIAAAGARAEDIDRQLPAPRTPYIGPYLQTPELRLRVASC